MKLVKKVGLEQQTNPLILDHFRMYCGKSDEWSVESKK